jgi:hypothetical protein
VPGFLEGKRKEIAQRLSELRPAVDEHRRLTEAVAALEKIGGSAIAAIVPGRRGPGRPRGSRRTTTGASTKGGRKPGRAAAKPSRPAAKRRAGRRKGSGTRAAEALSFVRRQPGVTIPELAAKVGIKQNYLYRVLPGLEQEGKVTKKGSEPPWVPRRPFL